MTAFRIARETKNYKADDLSGAGPAKGGGRWNDLQIPMVYASLTRALAALETLAHINEPDGAGLPLDRYLVEIQIPIAAWEARERFAPASHPGWDAIPESRTAMEWGSTWARERRSLIATVPSVIVPEEENVLLNPLHPDATNLKAKIVRKWLYDARIGTTRRSASGFSPGYTTWPLDPRGRPNG